MNPPIATPFTITLSGGEGHFDFYATGTLDSVWFQARSPNVGMHFDMEVASLTHPSKRWQNSDIPDPHLEVIDRALVNQNRLTIHNGSVADAVFDGVIFHYAIP